MEKGQGPNGGIRVMSMKEGKKEGIMVMTGIYEEEIEKLIVKEILICHEENTPTSQLTSLMMKIKGLNK